MGTNATALLIIAALLGGLWFVLKRNPWFAEMFATQAVRRILIAIAILIVFYLIAVSTK